MTTAVNPEIVTCPNCGAKNRVTDAQRARTPVCGQCKTPLPLASPSTSAGDGKPVEVTDATFADLVERSPLPVLLDVWATWCPPCRMLAPIVEQVAGRYAGRARVAKIDSDENPQTAGRFNISALPTLLILRGGREVDRIVGLTSADQIAKKLDAAIAAG